jgi:hypothetical protein
VFRVPAPDPTNELQAPRHTRLRQAQLINKEHRHAVRYAYNLGGYNWIPEYKQPLISSGGNIKTSGRI